MHLIIPHFGITIMEIASVMEDFMTHFSILMDGVLLAIGEVSILSIVPLIMVDFTILITTALAIHGIDTTDGIEIDLQTDMEIDLTITTIEITTAQLLALNQEEVKKIMALL